MIRILRKNGRTAVRPYNAARPGQNAQISPLTFQPLLLWEGARADREGRGYKGEAALGARLLTFGDGKCANSVRLAASFASQARAPTKRPTMLDNSVDRVHPMVA